MDALSIRDEIELLLKQFPDLRSKVNEIGKYNWKQIEYKVEERFVQKKHYKYDLHWAWLRFKEPQYAVSFVDSVYKYLQYFIDEKEIFFVVEDYQDKHWFYEGEAKVIIERIIPELCHLNEYYLISKKFDWILCENHHNVLCVSGRAAVDRITKFKEENNEEIIT